MGNTDVFPAGMVEIFAIAVQGARGVVRLLEISIRVHIEFNERAGKKFP